MQVWDALEVAFGGFLIGPDIITKGFGRMPFVKCAAKAGRMVDCAGELMEGGPANEHEQLREDMELEALVLDTLTDGAIPSLTVQCMMPSA